MRHKLRLAALLAVSLIGATRQVFASGLPGDDPAHPGFLGHVGQ